VSGTRCRPTPAATGSSRAGASGGVDEPRGLSGWAPQASDWRIDVDPEISWAALLASSFFPLWATFDLVDVRAEAAADPFEVAGVEVSLRGA
jgi:hypothetical protein